MTNLTPREEDPVVHDLLATLAHFSPSPGFSDQVMSHVWRPAPSWVRRTKRVWRVALNRRRVWAIAGGMAASSAAATAALAVGAMNHWIRIEAVWAVALSIVVDLWRSSVHVTAGLAVLSARWLHLASVDQPTLVGLAFGFSLLVGLSGLGLRRTIRQYRNERVFVHARK